MLTPKAMEPTRDENRAGESISQVHASLPPGASTTRRVRGQTWRCPHCGRVWSAAANPAVTAETDDERAAWIADDAAMERRADR